jgi:hypothetical protein
MSWDNRGDKRSPDLGGPGTFFLSEEEILFFF